MSHRLLGALAAAALAFAAGPAPATEAYVYTHNGSAMTLGIAADQVVIRYARPRPGIAGAGIRPGTVLFEGRLRGEMVEGTAFTFRRGCAPASYGVRGRMTAASRLVLTGPAPLWGAGCEIDGYDARSPHARLVVEFVSGQEGE